MLLEKHVIHGDDHAAGIARLERAAERRRELLADDPDDEDMARSLKATEAQIAELRAAPHEADWPAWREAGDGIKVADHWEALDTPGARIPARLGSNLLRGPEGAEHGSAGWSFTARRSGSVTATAACVLPHCPP